MENRIQMLARAAALAVLAAVAPAAGAANDRNAPVWYLKVQAQPGGVKTSRSGGLRLGISSCSSSSSSGGSSSRSVTSTLRWTAEVRLRGKGDPKSVAVRAHYVADGADGKKRILKSENLPVTLDESGKGSVDLKAPTVTQTRSRQRHSSGRSGSVSRSTTSVRGDRMAGCVAQLVVDGKIVKVWSSVSAWEKIAWDDPFTNESLTRKTKNALR